MAELRRIGESRDALGESPHWCARSGRLLWLDCREGVLHRLDLTSGQREDHPLPAPLGAMALHVDPDLVVLTLRHAVALYSLSRRTLTEVVRLDGLPDELRLNDAVADPEGGLIFGSMDPFRPEGTAPRGGLFRLAPDLTLTQFGPGTGVANGFCFDPSGHRLYLADSPSGEVRVSRFTQGGSLSLPEVLFRPDLPGFAADGMTVDAAGNLWIALVRIGAIGCFTPQGEVLQRIDLPLRHPSALIFGGAQMDRLFITSIHDSGRLRDESADAGGLFELTLPGLKGRGFIPLARLKGPER